MVLGIDVGSTTVKAVVVAFVAGMRKNLAVRGPVLFAQAKEEWAEARPVIEEQIKNRVAKVTRRRKPDAGAEATVSAA